MDWITRIRTVIYGGMICVPCMFSVLSIWKTSIPMVVAAVILVYVVVACFPFSKGYERIWVFLVAGVTVIPWNLVATFWWLQGEKEGTLLLERILEAIFVHIVLFCAEEVAFAFLSKKIWRKQKRISVKVEDREG